MRELPLPLVARMWDTYFGLIRNQIFIFQKTEIDSTAEEDGIAIFHVYVCVAFILHWAEKLKQMDFTVIEIQKKIFF
jgi:hypothetical protein